MPLEKLRQFLDQNDITYSLVPHPKAITAQEVAASAHIRGREVAKTVIVKLDEKLAMAVLPADHKLDLDLLASASGADNVELANESEFTGMFPGCEVGAMPPFGNLYAMDVYVEETLARDEMISFNAGTHDEMIRLSYADFERLVKPKVFGAKTTYAHA